MEQKRNYNDPRLSEEMRKYGCYTIESTDPNNLPHETQIILTPEFLANTNSFKVKTDLGFGPEITNVVERGANGEFVNRAYPERLYLDETPSRGHYTIQLTVTCECGETWTLTHQQARIMMRGAFEERYLPKVVCRCPKCNKMIFKP